VPGRGLHRRSRRIIHADLPLALTVTRMGGDGFAGSVEPRGAAVVE
jgi:hypothetical protein